MTIPGLLIEYLINGAMALIWLGPVLVANGVNAFESGTAWLLVISLYVIGMVIDFLAYWLVRPLKDRVRTRAWVRFGDGGAPPTEKSFEREIIFSLYAPEIAKEVSMRSSRDRIARGAIVNVLIALVLQLFADGYQLGVSIWLLAALLVLSVVMWWVFQYLSNGYEFKAALAVKNKVAKAGY